jgi:LacI family transcriptional regulator
MSTARVTLLDLAQIVGASPSTVSRALRSDPQFSLVTRLRVLRAAESHGYVPNSAARSLVVKASRTFGLLIPDLTDPLHGQVATGFEHEAAMAGYSVIIASILEDPARERMALQLFAGHRADGIAVMGSLQEPDEVVATLKPSPLVFVAAEHPRLARRHVDVLVGAIRADDVRGMEAVVDHLVQNGYRRIAYVGGPRRASNLVRRATVRRALAASGLGDGPGEITAGVSRWRSASALVDKILNKRPDALICYDDKLALGLLDALRSAGVNVPGDLAVVGFDDIVYAAISHPRLTTVAQPAEEMGRRAVQMLLGAIETRTMPASETLPRLVVRESSIRS